MSVVRAGASLASLLATLLVPSLARAAEVTAPVLIHRAEPEYPAEAIAARAEGVVMLRVIVGEDGAVRATEVLSAPHPALARSATTAVASWRFSPALRDGAAVSCRIRVPLEFALRAPVAATTTTSETRAPELGIIHDDATEHHARVDDEPPEHEHDDALHGHDDLAATSTVPAIDVHVHGRKRPPARGVSDFVLDRELLGAAPRQTAADLLQSAPGVYVSRPEGDAVAHQIFLRGFDAEHGQDIELTVEGLPINQPGHIHAQGYADLNFIIPELVRTVRVTEGVYDPRQGDFAVAGSIDFELGAPAPGLMSRSIAGSFGTLRQLVVWSPEERGLETFGAVDLRRTQGFGQNRGGLAGTGLAQYALELSANAHLRILAGAYGARAGLAGVVRKDDVDAGRVDLLDSYPDPTAANQSAFAARFFAAMIAELAGERGDRTNASLWVQRIGFRSRSNFTGYRLRARQNPDWVGRGDLIENENNDLALGARFEHTTRRLALFPSVELRASFGVDLRTRTIDQAQNLLQAPQNETWDRRIDATILATDVGAHLDGDLALGANLHLRGGLRADALHFDVNDRLGNALSRFQQQTYYPGFRRTALGFAIGPRVTLEYSPERWLRLLAAYGEGFRSPQPLQLEEGENAPFSRVRSAELGLKLEPDRGRVFSLSAAGFGTFLSEDIAFDPLEGRATRIGPTTRLGAVLQLCLHPMEMLFANASLTYTRATLDQPPPATPENPAPPFTPGELLPYVPPLVARVDADARLPITTLLEAPVEARAGLGFTALSSRPLPYGRFADPLALLDARASLAWRWVTVGLELYNLFDLRYAGTEYSFASTWDPKALPSLVPARHLSAGAPRTILFSLELRP